MLALLSILEGESASIFFKISNFVIFFLIVRYVIKGNKKFEGSVTVKNLQLSLLDNIHVNKAVTKDSSVKITGMKNFESVLVAEDIEANSSVVNNINNVHLKLFQADALYVDEETYLPHVIFNDLIGICFLIYFVFFFFWYNFLF